MSDPADEHNKAVVREFFERLFVHHDVEGAAALIREDYIQHNPNVADGRAAACEKFRSSIQAFPARRGEIKRIIAQGDLVAVHSHMKPTPDSLGNAVMDFFRIEDGLIAEHWDVSTPVAETSKNANTMF